MKKLDVLIKSVTLLYREQELRQLDATTPESGSEDLVITVLNNFDKNDKASKLVGGDSPIVVGLTDLLLEMTSSSDIYDKLTLKQTLKLIVKDDENLLKIIMDNIDPDLDGRRTRLSINILRKYLKNFFKAQEVKKIISFASYKVNTGKIKHNELNDFINTIKEELDALETSNTIKDPAVSKSIDLSDTKSVEELLQTVKEEAESVGKLKLGWKALNDMTNGGFKRGEFVMLNALQHKYKSGMIASLFCQIPMFNKPVMLNPEKKPLIVLFSLEDDLSIVIAQMYKYLYYDEFKAKPDMASITSKDMSDYIGKKLGVNGYHIKMLRADPTQWTYKKILSNIVDLESEGYEVHALFVDYLSLVPTTGCISSGPTGTDLRDLYRRIRNFCSNRKITFVTPHQLSTEAKQLLRNGVSDMDFVKEITGKGYFSNSRQLDQEVDLELYIHIGRLNRKPILTMQRGKHRGNIVDDELLYFGLHFPHKMPIPSDLVGVPEVTWYPNGGGQTDKGAVDDGLNI